MATKKTDEPKLLKEAALRSKRYANDRDIVQIMLEPDKLYTRDEIDKIIEKFKKREVK